MIEQLNGVAASGPQPRREIVYGLEYIDEPVAQYLTDAAGNVTQHFILQDANYNVVALTDSSGNLHQEYHYSPYGELVKAYDSTGAALTLPDQLDTILTFQGSVLDPETGNIEKRARTLLTSLGRFAQMDPNQTALLVGGALLQNAQTPAAFVSVTAGAQYLDGPNPYQFVGSNPITGHDPSGLLEFTLPGQAATGTIMAELGALASGAATAAQAWAYAKIGSFVAYSYVTSVAALSVGSAAAYGVDMAVFSALQYEFARWFSDKADRTQRHLRQGFEQGVQNASSGGNPNDPNDWRRVVDVFNNGSDLAKAVANRMRVETSFDAVAKHLVKNHGGNIHKLSDALHKIKQRWGLGGRDNVYFGLTGDVYHPHTGDLTGNLLTAL